MVTSKISVIVTFLNEEKTIHKLLNALAKQTVLPNEVVFTDGGSTDKTVQLIKAWQKKQRLFPVRTFFQKGYRGIGRNTAIKNAKNQLIAITDAGCIPDKRWLEELYLEYKKSKSDVVAGYYWAKPKNTLEEAIIPYIFVMPDRVDPSTFLPATRSMLVTKAAWKRVGGFNELLPTCEDYVFAKALQKSGFSISFVREATVQWLPTASLKSFYRIMYEQAQYDVVAGVTRPKALLVVLRYIIGMLLILNASLSQNSVLLLMIAVVGFTYLLWSIIKNIRYTPRGWFWLPLLQLFADVGVLLGTVRGTFFHARRGSLL